MVALLDALVIVVVVVKVIAAVLIKRQHQQKVAMIEVYHVCKGSE